MGKLQSWDVNSLHSFVKGVYCSLATLGHLVQVTWRFVHRGALDRVSIVKLRLQRHANVHGLLKSRIFCEAVNQLKLLQTKL
jgi:hypothetical protein